MKHRIQIRKPQTNLEPEIVKTLRERVFQLEDFVSKQQAIIESRGAKLDTIEEKHKQEIARLKQQNKVEEFMQLSKLHDKLEDEHQALLDEMDKWKQAATSDPEEVVNQILDQNGSYSISVGVVPSRPCKKVKIHLQVMDANHMPVFDQSISTSTGKATVRVPAKQIADTLYDPSTAMFGWEWEELREKS